MSIFLYPYSRSFSTGNNPYIKDFFEALIGRGITVTNAKSKNNALLPLLPNIFKADKFIFHWIEDVPSYKFGFLQFLYVVFCLQVIRILRKDVIWFQHNSKSHHTQSFFEYQCSKYLINTLRNRSKWVFTHAECASVFSSNYKFLMHPIKNNLRISNVNIVYDILVWGRISRYKGIVEFLKYCRSSDELSTCRIKIIGKCLDPELFMEINEQLYENVSFENRDIDFAELSELYGKVNYVLIPYFPQSIFSSGILMDSLSYGYKVIGPNVAVFKELSQNDEVIVKTFDSFEDIAHILKSSVPETDYTSFISDNSWDSFIKRFINTI